jgi:hypothetical protein
MKTLSRHAAIPTGLAIHEGRKLNQQTAWVIETLACAFQPLDCECSPCVDGALSIKIFDKTSGRVDLTVVGVSLDRVRSMRDLSVLIAELRDELKTMTSPSLRVSGSSS